MTSKMTHDYFQVRMPSAQTDRQVVARELKLNLRRGLYYVAKRTRKFPRKYTQLA